MLQDEGIRNLATVDTAPPVKMTFPGIIGKIIKLVVHHAPTTSRTHHDIPPFQGFQESAPEHLQRIHAREGIRHVSDDGFLHAVFGPSSQAIRLLGRLFVLPRLPSSESANRRIGWLSRTCSLDMPLSLGAPFYVRDPAPEG
jgi:hypothetical protein